ncbi:MAG: acVLRF1 family peptidyl-tRNA hydrolase [Dermatophilaceae bacterium]
MAERVVEVAPDRLPGWLERFGRNNPNGPQRILATSDPLPAPFAVLLIRRGGYAVGVADRDALLAHKVGTRRVQSRTAAGGWSQQRFARRRDNQADALVGAVADHLVRVRESAGVAVHGLALGGDRALVAQVLEDSRLVDLRHLPTREYPGVSDPRRVVLDEVARRARAYEVRIDDGPQERPNPPA